MAELRIGSLCSGYGGLDLAALAVVGGSIAWHAENDPAAAEILAHHWPEVPNHGDITRTDWNTVEPIDVLAAGFPCQPASNAGHRKGTNDARWLWPHVATAIRVLRPRLVLLENVSALLGRGFADCLADLAALRFDAQWLCIRASDAVGAPHPRDRLFILARPAADAAHLGHQRPGSAWERRNGPAHHDLPAAHASGDGRHERRSQSARQPGGSGTASRGVQAWGPYEAAIRRWERILGRPAPDPSDLSPKGPRLAPGFVEWLMGLPAGWVTGVPTLSRNAQLHALGNGVIPAHAEAAYRALLARTA